MNVFIILLVVYAILMSLAAYTNFKNKGSISMVTCIVIGGLLVFSFLKLFTTIPNINFVIILLLIALSITLYLDRKNSGEEIHIQHHLIRLAIHLIMIYFLLK